MCFTKNMYRTFFKKMDISKTAERTENNPAFWHLLVQEFEGLPSLITKYPKCNSLRVCTENLIRSGSISLHQLTGENTTISQFTSLTLVNDDTTGFLLSPSRVLRPKDTRITTDSSVIFGICQFNSNSFRDGFETYLLLAADDTIFIGDIKNITCINNEWISKLIRL